MLLLGYECDADEARWMVWHRKGVSATTGIRLRSGHGGAAGKSGHESASKTRAGTGAGGEKEEGEEGQKMFLRVVMCTLLWREPEHFGFPEGYEGTSPFSLVVTVTFAPCELVVCVEFTFHSDILW